MSAITYHLLADLSWVSSVLDTRTWATVLWSGLGLLTLALIVLMVTRWGSVRPLSKCIVLSVFAHTLFMVYAYSTDLFVEGRRRVKEDVIEFNLMADMDDHESNPDASDVRPWDNPSQDVVAPALNGPSRLTEPATPDVQRQETASVPELNEPPVPAAGIEEGIPQLSEPPVTVPQAARTNPAVAAAEMETPVTINQEPQPTAEPPLPAAEPLARRDPLDLPADEPSERTAMDDVPSNLLEIGSQLQKLADVPVFENLPAESLAANHDRTQGTQRPDIEHEGGGPRAAPQEAFSLSGKPKHDAVGGRQAVRRMLAQPAPRRLGDGAQMPNIYRIRLEANRSRVARKFGGTAETERAVEAALKWLAANQSRDGRWDPDLLEGGRETHVEGHDRNGAGARADTGITGLALLALLASGQTHLEGKYRENVQHGLEFLLRSQAANGSLAGESQLFAMMYCHGMASLALSEAYAMSGDHRLKPSVERAAQYTIQSQHPTSGGWRYQPREEGDMSQFGWQLMALKSAELAGVSIPATTRSGMLRFMKSVASGTHGGLASYRRGERPTPAMTGEALTCRCFLELAYDADMDREASRFVALSPPAGPKPNLYYWYYGTIAMFQVQGPEWEQWNMALQQQLLPRQRTEGELAGSWDPDTVWGRYGGRAYSTALAALSLEVYYRYLPMYAVSRTAPTATSFGP